MTCPGPGAQRFEEPRPAAAGRAQHAHAPAIAIHQGGDREVWVW